jgi:hypothetical protein
MMKRPVPVVLDPGFLYFEFSAQKVGCIGVGLGA